MNKHYTVLLSPVTNHVSKRHTERLGEHDYVNEMGQKIWISGNNHYYAYTSGALVTLKKLKQNLLKQENLHLLRR